MKKKKARHDRNSPCPAMFTKIQEMGRVSGRCMVTKIVGLNVEHMMGGMILKNNAKNKQKNLAGKMYSATKQRKNSGKWSAIFIF